MARRGFWDSFYQGWEQGDKIGERNRGLQQRAEFKKIAGEDQVDSSQYDANDFTDDAEKAGGVWSEADQAFKLPNGGLQKATNTPKWDAATNSYQGAQGQSLKPKAQFTLGGQTQAQRFTPDQVQDYRNNRYADVYAANGDIDKAMGVRASAQSMKLGKVQLEQADAAGKEANNVRKLMKIQGEFLSGAMDPEEAIKQAIGIADKANGDGITFAYKPVGDGKYEITELRNDKVFGSKVVDPTTVLKEALKYASPTMYAQALQQENSDKTYKAGRDDAADNKQYRNDTLTQNQAQFSSNLAAEKEKFDELKRQFGLKYALEAQEANSNAGLRRAQAGYYSRDRDTGNAKGVGYLTNSGEAVEYSKDMGYFTRGLDGKPTPVKDLRTISGIGTARPDKGITLDDRKKAEELLRMDPAFDSMPRAKQDEVRNALLGITPEPTMQVAPPPSADKTGGLQAKKPLDWDKVDNVQRAIGGLSESRKRAELLEAANAEARRLGTYNK